MPFRDAIDLGAIIRRTGGKDTKMGVPTKSEWTIHEFSKNQHLESWSQLWKVHQPRDISAFTL